MAGHGGGENFSAHQQRRRADLQFRGGHRRAEQSALHQSAIMIEQKIQLSLIFHAFGDHFQIQAAGEGDDGAGDGGILGVVGDVAQKTAVDFEAADGELFEMA